MIIRDPGKRHIAWFDVHVPHQAKLAEPLAFAKEYKPDYFIIGGDFLDCQWASHWNSVAFKRIGFDKLRALHRDEYLAGRDVINDIRKTLPKAKIVYIPGNHEDWLVKASYHFPELGISSGLSLDKIRFKTDLSLLMKHELAEILRRELDLDKFKVHCLDYEEPLKIGRLMYFHGHQFGGQRPTATSVKRWPGINAVFGHHHKHEVTPMYNQGEPKKVHEHVSVPCLSKLGPGYLKDRSTMWLQGFWCANISRGLFDGRVVKMFDGRIIR